MSFGGGPRFQMSNSLATLLLPRSRVVVATLRMTCDHLCLHLRVLLSQSVSHHTKCPPQKVLSPL